LRVAPGAAPPCRFHEKAIQVNVASGDLSTTLDSSGRFHSHLVEPV
jgi:hypothetical protein